MASYTTNYQLHQWVPGDNFLRTDFNEDFAKIDAAIKGVETAANTALAGKAGTAALEAVQALANGKAEVVLGTYTGTGGTKAVSLGFRPRAVFITYTTYVGMAAQGASQPMITLTGSGFTVEHISNYGSTPNMEGAKYAYLAFR